MAVLIVMPCSRDKAPGPVMAINKYLGKGYFWRQVREAYPELVKRGHQVCVMSAKYGFLRPDDVVDDYDLRMDDAIARRFRDDAVMRKKFFDTYHEGVYAGVVIVGGKTYWSVTEAWCNSDNIRSFVLARNQTIGVHRRELLNFIRTLLNR